MGLFDNVKSSVGSLFNRPQVKQLDLQLDLDADPGIFYATNSSDGSPGGHSLFKTKVSRGPLEVGPRIPLSCMFEAHWLLRKGQRVGFNFVSQFQTVNHGGYLLTRMVSGASKATSVETLLKTDDLVVFNYPNKGTLVISMKISEDVASIFDEQ